MISHGNAPDNYDAQESLLAIMKAEKIPVQLRGVCAGASISSIQMALSSQSTDEFDNLIYSIYSTHASHKANTRPEIYALIKQIQIINSPEKHRDVFNGFTILQSEFNNIAQVLESDESDKLINNDVFMGSYTKRKIAHLIQCIDNANTDKNQDLAFSIKSPDHQISLVYQHGKWRLTNISHMPTQHFDNTPEGYAALAEAIHLQMDVHDKSKRNALAFASFSKMSKANAINDVLLRLEAQDEYKRIHRLKHNKKVMIINQRDALNLAIHAITYGNKKLLKRLIKYGFNTDQIHERTFTLLYIAAQLGTKGMLKILFQDKLHPSLHTNLKDKINSVSHNGETALFGAVTSGKADNVRYLLENGARVDILRADKFSVIGMAVNHGNMTIIKMLLEAGADITEKTPYGTLTEIATRNKMPQVVEYINRCILAKQNGLPVPDLAVPPPPSPYLHGARLFKQHRHSNHPRKESSYGSETAARTPAAAAAAPTSSAFKNR